MLPRVVDRKASNGAASMAACAASARRRYSPAENTSDRGNAGAAGAAPAYTPAFAVAESWLLRRPPGHAPGFFGARRAILRRPPDRWAGARATSPDAPRAHLPPRGHGRRAGRASASRTG